MLLQRIPGLFKGELFYNDMNKIQEFKLGDKHLWLTNNYKAYLIEMEAEFNLNPYFPISKEFIDEDAK